MWTPKPLYETLPVLYVLAGLSVIIANAYIGIHDATGYGWMFVGLLLVGHGAHINALRVRYRAALEQ
ncbi:MAG: hypothetical protein AAGJ86_01935 [Pseudomonadota bacterium]